jgi:hypothetical protein
VKVVSYGLFEGSNLIHLRRLNIAAKVKIKIQARNFTTDLTAWR